MSTTTPCACNRLLIAIDEHQPAQWAVQVGRVLAQQLSSPVMLLNVIETATAPGDNVTGEQEVDTLERRQGHALLARNSLLFSLPVTVQTSLRTGLPADQIAAVAREWKADMVVIGTHGRSRLSQFVLGSTADAVIRQAGCPVITVAHPPRHTLIMPNERLGAVPDNTAPIARVGAVRTCDWVDGETPLLRNVSEVQ